MNKARLMRGVVLIVVCILAARAFFGGFSSDNLIASLAPQNILKFAMPSLVGAYEEEEKNIAEHEEQEDVKGDERIKFELLEVERDVPDKIMIELLGTRGKGIDLSGEQPAVLIYHTHTTEAYTATKANPYKQTDKWRTDDEEKNVVRIGEVLATLLKEEYGIAVIHDTTNHEPPYLGTSYERSIDTMESYLEKYPTLQLFIDVHRDAYTLKAGEENSDYVVINGTRTARLMFVVGTGEGKTGAGFKIKPNYKENYALARAVTENLQKIDSKLTRPIRVKSGRYNQHIPGRALLVEVGHNANTLEEALNSVQYLAQAIAQSVELAPEPSSTP